MRIQSNEAHESDGRVRANAQPYDTLRASLELPPYATEALAALEAAGHESWVVGGFVRDALLGRTSSDVDIATRAFWREARGVFEDCGWHVHETGTAHSTITVVIDGHALEVTTFRSDGPYEDARHPQRVSFVRTIEEDLARRDFTVNALAYHPERGLLDPFGGRFDIETRMIRAVGDPDRRFAEDALRILRACRFVAQLGFSIDEDTYRGMLANKGLLPLISVERVAHELSALLLGPFAGDALMSTVDALSAVLPELVSMKGFEQRTPYHIYDVLEHTARVIDGVPAYPLVRWAALFHDMGKPAAFFAGNDGVGHFYGHARISVELARGIMRRLSMPGSFSERVLELVERHDDDIASTSKAVKRALARLGGDAELFAALCDLKRGDAQAQAPRCIGRVALADELERILDGILSEDEVFSLKQLALGGRDVIALGIEQGPRVGQALNAALEAVIDGHVSNDRDELRAFVAAWRTEREDER